MELDPAGAALHVRRSPAPDGTWMIVEPFAHDTLEDNLNPVGRVFYSASTMIGGFSRFRRATETPFNLVVEARP